ncbi:type IV secretory system conjugative DNA transfer family protein [Microvirga lotononidis]|uniref:Type IV secretory pathway, VirD4 component n=1 Tax=Microvirga lotononidis TaxID=864069 RepID=I4YRC1_9HYPH|nr:type IV secretory system conjugative DNA transfer family protein [Microvirga lotononidis]EIM26513.1 type IV secretory pathway, VirD4 component [Microvirga lotononidis]WQO31197.1 type IV secretory system conjugative DNA transfer family protein [Microvirga lotononidis]
MNRKLGRYVKAGALVVCAIAVLSGAFVVWSFNYAAATYLLSRQTAMWKAVVVDGSWRAALDQVVAYWGHPMVMKLVTVSTVALFCEILALVAIGALIYFQPWKVKAPKGAARIATEADLKKAGLLDGVPGKSIVLGSYKGKKIRYSGDSHIYVNGPTRSGKGVGFVLTNGLEWRGSLIALDVKKEMWQEVGPARLAMGQEVFLFSPGSAESHCWNPLDSVSDWPRRSTEIENIANTLMPSPEKGDAFWTATARSVFAGLLGYVLDSKRMERRRTIRSVVRLFSTGKDLASVMKTILNEEPDLHPYVADKFRQHISRDPEQRPSFEAHIMTALNAWNGALMAAATSRSDFDIAQLRRKPFTVFIGTPAGDLGSAEALIRLFIQQVHDVLMRELPGKDEPHKLLMMLDEFYQFGRLPEIVDKTPLVAGYGFKIAIIAQNIPQLDARYGKPIREMLLGNMDVKLNIAVGDKATADYVSEELGRHYILREGWSSSPGKGGMGLRSNSRSGRFEAEPLISSDAVRRFDNRKSLLLVRGHNGAVLDKLHFFLDRDYIEARKKVAGFGEALNVPVLEPLKEGPLFEPAPEAVTAAPEPESVKPAIAAPEPVAAIATPISEPYAVEVLERTASEGVVAATAVEDEEEVISLDLPAFGSLRKLLSESEAVAKTHPVVARLRNVVAEEARTGFLEPGTDISAFIRA